MKTSLVQVFLFFKCILISAFQKTIIPLLEGVGVGKFIKCFFEKMEIIPKIHLSIVCNNATLAHCMGVMNDRNSIHERKF